MFTSFRVAAMVSIVALTAPPAILAAVEDRAEDRLAVERAISALNAARRAPDLLTHDADVTALGDLMKGKRVRFRIAMAEVATTQPTVVISHEPWGEAELNFPGTGMSWVEEMVNPRLTAGTVRFVSSEVALAEGYFRYTDGSSTQVTPLLFALRKEGGTWKIAAIRVLGRL